MMVHGREFGFPKVNIMLPGAAFIVHFFATIYWFGETRATMNRDQCTTATDDKTEIPQVCGTLGPGLAMGNCVLIGLTTVIFVVVYSARGKVYVKVGLAREAEMAKLKRQESDPGSTDGIISNRI